MKIKTVQSQISIIENFQKRMIALCNYADELDSNELYLRVANVVGALEDLLDNIK